MRSLDFHFTMVTPLFNIHLVHLVVCHFSSGRCHKKHHDYKFLSIPCIIPKNVLITCVVFVHGTKSTLVKGKCLTHECGFCPVVTRHLKTFWTLFMRSLDFHFTIRVTPLFNNVQRRTLGTGD